MDTPRPYARIGSQLRGLMAGPKKASAQGAFKFHHSLVMNQSPGQGGGTRNIRPAKGLSLAAHKALGPNSAPDYATGETPVRYKFAVWVGTAEPSTGPTRLGNNAVWVNKANVPKLAPTLTLAAKNQRCHDCGKHIGGQLAAKKVFADGYSGSKQAPGPHQGTRPGQEKVCGTGCHGVA